MKGKIPLPGMRTIKTAVAVIVCFLISVPFVGESALSVRIAPFYPSIAAVVCMQGSVGESWQQGLSRLLGTLVGGLVGLGCVSVTTYWDHFLVMTLVCGVGTVLAIYVCNLLRQPKACAIAAIVCCSIMFSHSGPGRYAYTVSRMGETAVGILVAVAINRLLPDRRDRPKDE